MVSRAKKAKVDKQEFVLSTVRAFMGANIPLEKIDHPKLRDWINKFIEAVQKMAMEMLHSSVPTRIAPKPETKSSVSVAAPESTETRGTRQKPAGAVQAGGGGCESLASGEGGTTAPADAQAQSSFLAETMCSFQECHEPVFPCRYCGEMFLVKSSLILHQTTYHPEHPVGCEQCGKVNYRSRSEFMGHLCDHADSAMEH